MNIKNCCSLDKQLQHPNERYMLESLQSVINHIELSHKIYTKVLKAALEMCRPTAQFLGH